MLPEPDQLEEIRCRRPNFVLLMPYFLHVRYLTIRREINYRENSGTNSPRRVNFLAAQS
jgi:hypothetical protein